MFKKYLQYVLAAKILIVYFVVCTLAVKKKSGQVSTCRTGPFPCQSFLANIGILALVTSRSLSATYYSLITPSTDTILP
jgi:hypothetical protein